MLPLCASCCRPLDAQQRGCATTRVSNAPSIASGSPSDSFWREPRSRWRQREMAHLKGGQGSNRRPEGEGTRLLDAGKDAKGAEEVEVGEAAPQWRRQSR
eukprot:2427183-Rhodomonas_salina.1